jgi:thiol-disulfide isomerase/thioredoxin
MKLGTLVVVWLAVGLVGCAALNQGQYDGIERGWLDRSVFEKSAFMEWKITHDTTQIAPEMIDMIHQVQGGIDIIAFLGTWCPDSKREIPRFLKIADLAGIGAANLKLYGLDRSKKSPDGLTEKYSINRIPTFIFLKDGQEVGRITEFPQTTLEGDILTILVAARSK